MVENEDKHLTVSTDMRSGHCPKCGSNEVHSGAKTPDKAGFIGSNSIPIGGLYPSAMLDNYVCVRCGYIESYVADQARLREIAQEWPKARR